MANEWLFPSETQYEEPVIKSKHEDLFVFGYACKLFRDDDQARDVDKGTYMIPWMGDDRLLIDRYDGRGHLYDLNPYDADIKKGRPPPTELSEDEKQIEKLCDEERYLELHTDLAEKSMYEEEEWKRYYESLAEGYNAVGFSYDYYGQPQYSQEAESSKEKPLDPGDEPYIAPASLQVPAGMSMPATIKEQAIVEKTAKFIAEHGTQMEIMLKTKQANNDQFLFMHFENVLHPFYKHMIKMIKSKKYIPVTETKQEDAHNDSGEMEDGAHGYLHPALLTTNRASPTPEVYKPVQMPKVSIHETSYGQLLQSLTKVDQSLVEKRNKLQEIKQEVKQESDEGLPFSSYNNMPPPPGIEPVTLPSQHTDIKQEPEEDSSEAGAPVAPIVPPPPDAQPVVDRMAMYVAKNGQEFEMVVKNKNDPRFQFLETWHVHYSYYLFKKNLFEKEMEREKKEKELEEKRLEKEKADKLAKGVKFKLKKAKEQEGSTLEKKKVFDNDESSEEDHPDGEGQRERKHKSGSTTPVTDTDVTSNPKHGETHEKKLAEQRVKDRLAASAREKLSQVDKEKQMQLERKKKAAMFINLLKSKSTESAAAAANTDSKATSPMPSSNSTSKSDDHKSSSRHKSKHKSRDRSRSRSKSRSKKKRRRRSPTPPSAYVVPRRSPSRRPPLGPPISSRYDDLRSRYSRSPSHRSRRHSRSKSRSPSKSKSKKKKRSRSPRSKSDSSHKKSSKKKKKKRSRSRSRSKHKDSKKSVLMSGAGDNVRVMSPDGESRVTPVIIEDDELEDGETKDSSPEPGELTDHPQSRTPDIRPQDIQASDIQASDIRLEQAPPPATEQSASPSQHMVRSSSSSPVSCHSQSTTSSPHHTRTPSPSQEVCRSRSPSQEVCRSRSPSQKRKRSRSPSQKSKRSRSPSQKSKRSRSPSQESKRSRSPSQESKRFRSPSQESMRSRSPSQEGRRSRSPSQEGRRSRSQVHRSPSPEVGRSSSQEISSPRETTAGADRLSREGTPSRLETLQNGAGDGEHTKNVSQYMLSRVRQLIKASRSGISSEEEEDGS